MSDTQNDPRRRHSSKVVDGPGKSAGRAMLRAVGFTDEDFQKPQIGIASTWSQVTPCNSHIGELAERACEGADGAGGKGVIFNTITISIKFSSHWALLCNISNHVNDVRVIST